VTGPLQPFDFRHSQYERPNERWVCGRSAAGEPCHQGPSARGRCPVAVPECAPTRRPDGGWACQRPAALGGSCRPGPSADGTCGRRAPRCAPRRHHRAVRGRLSRAVLLLLLAGLLVGLATEPAREALVDPGPLTIHHEAMASECQACHSAAEGGLAGWLGAAADADRPVADSERCAGCHDFGPAPLGAHGLPTELREELTMAAAAAVRSAQAAGGEVPTTPWPLAAARGLEGAPPQEGVACATCHREHHGRGHELTAMDDRRCQACHVEAFRGMGAGHPPFRDFGADADTGIAFPHRRHLVADGDDKSFHARKDQPVAAADLGRSCADCHEPSPDGRHLLLHGYASCAACHDEGLALQLEDGVAVVALPDMVVDGLEGVGAWPAFEGATRPSALTAVLLRGDPEAADDGGVPPPPQGETFLLRCAEDPAHELGEVLVFEDGTKEEPYPFGEVPARWTPPFPGEGKEFVCVECDGPAEFAPDPEAAAAAATYARAVKRLLGDLLAASRGDLEPLRARFGRIAGRPVAAEEVQPFARALSREALEAAVAAWTPDLTEPGPAGPGATRFLNEDDAAAEHLEGGGRWSVAGMRVVYRPEGAAHADPVLKACLDLLGALDLEPGEPAAEELFAVESAPACLKCHGPTRVGGDVAVRWRAAWSSDDLRGFTEFAHAPHTLFPEHQILDGAAYRIDCLSCHRVADAPAAGAGEVPTWAEPAEVELHEFDRAGTCASCHAPEAARTLAPTGATCPVCDEPLAAGELAVLCEECAAVHHGACFDREGACALCEADLAHTVTVGARHRGPPDCLTCHAYHVGPRRTDWRAGRAGGR